MGDTTLLGRIWYLPELAEHAGKQICFHDYASTTFDYTLSSFSKRRKQVYYQVLEQIRFSCMVFRP